jgi:cell division protein FtsQ
MSHAAFQAAQARRAAANERKDNARAILGAVVRTLAAAALSAALGAALFLGYRWAGDSSAFAIREIHFRGLAHATESQLLARSGLRIGENLFRADLLHAARAIETNPWVAAARVSRDLPSTVEVTVVEHEPVALVQMGALYLLDERGRLFKRLSPGERLDLPIISGLSRQEPHRELRLLHALHFLDTWRAAGFGPGELSQLRLEDDGAVTAFARYGSLVQEVRLGASGWQLALRRLSAMRSALGRRGERATKIDLDNPARPSEAAATLAEKR